MNIQFNNTLFCEFVKNIHGKNETKFSQEAQQKLVENFRAWYASTHPRSPFPTKHESGVACAYAEQLLINEIYPFIKEIFSDEGH